METLTKSFSTSYPEEGNAKKIFVCIKAVSPTTSVLCLETRPFQSGIGALQQIWGNHFLYAFPPFCLTLQVLQKVSYDQTEKMLLVTPTWQSQILYPLLLEMSTVSPLLLPKNTSLINPRGEVHPLMANRTLRLAVWTIYRKDYLKREFQKQLPNLLQIQDEQIYSQITIRPEECGLAGVINNRVMHFDVM